MALTRRDFLKDAGVLVAALGLSPTLAPDFAQALEKTSKGHAPLLWLQGQSCSGCSVSLLNSESPGPADLLTRYLSVYFHQTIAAPTGKAAIEAIESAISAGGYILAVEGSVPAGMPAACKIGDKHFSTLLLDAARSAKLVANVGTCAAFGGVPAAGGNPTASISANEFLKNNGVTAPMVNLPGCPAHPAWIVGNLIHLLTARMPELNEDESPKRTYGELLHDQCPLFAQYQIKHFAENPGDEGCLFKLGCQGVVVRADCSMRGWNGGVNWCIRGKSVCAGCAGPKFARDPRFPFYRINEEV